MNTFCRWEVCFGLLAGIALSGCGGRSVLDDERPYGDGRTEGINGREILPVGSGVLGEETRPTGTGTVVTVTGSTGQTFTTTPTATGVNPQPTVTATVNPTPTVGPSVMPTTVPTTTGVPTTGFPTTTAVPTTTSTSTITNPPTTSTSTDVTDPLPALVPFPPAGYAPSVPPGFEGVVWQDPWQCYPSVYNRTDYCSLSFSCDGRDYGSANCSLSNGEWYCDCSSNREYASITFGQDAVLEGEACRVAGALCVSDWPEEQTGACNESVDQGLEYCSYGIYCDQQLDSDDVHAKKSYQEYTNCNYSSVNGEEFVSCGCSNASLGEFSVDWDPSTSCYLAQAACAAGVDAGSQGEVACQWTSSSSELTYCQSTDRCTQAATAGGVPIGLVLYEQTYCYLDSEDTWGCSCSTGVSRSYTADDARAACEAAQVDCQSDLGLPL